MTAREFLADLFAACTIIALPFVLAWAHYILTGHM